jgi:hypothetical protein
MKTLRIGSAGYDQMKARTMAIAHGEHRPRKDEPTVWFTSVDSFAKVLSARNRDLLELIARERPGSIRRARSPVRPRQIQPVADVQDDGALRPGRAGEARPRPHRAPRPLRPDQTRPAAPRRGPELPPSGGIRRPAARKGFRHLLPQTPFASLTYAAKWRPFSLKALAAVGTLTTFLLQSTAWHAGSP